MNNINRDQHICKHHSARSDKETSQVCPSKLSKRELEDLYFKLLENNTDLKRTVNNQKDRMKFLSAKVQRMTALQKNSLGKEDKDCCVATKAVVSEQKESLAELQKKNELLSAKINQLNMKLCTAKQFSKKSPSQVSACCGKCGTAPPPSIKNSYLNIVSAKKSNGNVKTEASLLQFLEKEMTSTRTDVNESCVQNKEITSARSVETETTGEDKEVRDMVCNENKCKCLMEELKQKISNLKEELSGTHSQYSCRISRLEDEVGSLRAERARHVAALQKRLELADKLAITLRDTDMKYNEMAMQLSIERGKVAELEARARSNDMSTNVAKTIEGLANSKVEPALKIIDRSTSPVSSMGSPKSGNSNMKPNRDIGTGSPKLKKQETKVEKSSSPIKQRDWDTGSLKFEQPSTSKGSQDSKYQYLDDSGYAETKSQFGEKSPMKDSTEIARKLDNLQYQLDALKKSLACDPEPSCRCRKKGGYKAYAIEIRDPEMQLLKNSKDYKCVIIDPTKKIIVEVPNPTGGSPERYILGQTDQITRVDEKTFQQICAEKTNNDPFSDKPVKDTDYKDVKPTPSSPPVKIDSIDSQSQQMKSSKKQFSLVDDKPESQITNKATAVTDDSGKKGVKCDETCLRDKKKEQPKKESSKKEEKKKKVICECHIASGVDNASVAADKAKNEQVNKNEEVDKNEQTPVETKEVKESEKPAFVTSDETSMQGDVKAGEAVVGKENVFDACTRGPPAEAVKPLEECKGQTGPGGCCSTYSRGTSPDNTDKEIATLTDLPSEKDDVRSSPEPNRTRAIAGVGAFQDDRTTNMYLDSPTPTPTPTPTPHYSQFTPLSEGEVPHVKVRRYSLGETVMQPVQDVPMSDLRSTTTERMQQTLDAITDELARCRALLEAKPLEVT